MPCCPTARVTDPAGLRNADQLEVRPKGFQQDHRREIDRQRRGCAGWRCSEGPGCGAGGVFECGGATVKKAKRKPRWRHMRFRKGDVAHNLLAATQHYVKAKGGTAVVLGGIYIFREPGDLPARYKIAVGCLGRPPIKPEEK